MKCKYLNQIMKGRRHNQLFAFMLFPGSFLFMTFIVYLLYEVRW